MEHKYGFSLRWMAVTCFELRFGNTTVVSDPFITECDQTDLTWEDIEKCDMICLSHAHWDHITDIPRLGNKFQPKILCGEQTALQVARWLNYNATFVYPMYPDTELDFGDVKVRALYGRHTNLKKGLNDLTAKINTNPICSADPGMAALQEIGSFEYRNFLFTLPNGTKILLWGNNPTVEQLSICKALKPDVAILQRSVNPDELAEKAEFAAQIGCKVLIPHHHDFKKPEDPAVISTFREEFLKRVPDGVFLSPDHGQWVDL